MNDKNLKYFIDEQLLKAIERFNFTEPKTEENKICKISVENLIKFIEQKG
jgi:hypothetical protein